MVGGCFGVAESYDDRLVYRRIATCRVAHVQLNRRAKALLDKLIDQRQELRVEVHDLGATVVDLGIKAKGGLEAGRRLAEVCLADLAQVELVPCDSRLWSGLAVSVRTDHPVLACLASQYAGWKVSHGKFFAMGSGPMRAAAGKEEIFSDIGYREAAEVAVGVLETGRLPPAEALEQLARECGVPLTSLQLAVAPTRSQAGAVQIVARSVETALHKLHELKFDLSRVESGWGIAPLPPVAADDLAGIGRTNDAILYGGDVTLWVRGDDESLVDIGPRVPSNHSADYGQPFSQIFERYNHDFYRIDPSLFSPAVVRFLNVDTGRCHCFGQFSPDVLKQSFQA